MTTNSGKVIKNVSGYLMNSSKGKQAQLEHICTVLKALKERKLCKQKSN